MQETQITLPAEGFVRPKILHKILGIGLNTLWDWVAQHKFPRGIKLSARITVWNVADVRRWMEEQQNKGRCL